MATHVKEHISLFWLPLCHMPSLSRPALACACGTLNDLVSNIESVGSLVDKWKYYSYFASVCLELCDVNHEQVITTIFCLGILFLIIEYRKSSNNHYGAYQQHFRSSTVLIRKQRLLQNLMKEYESETIQILYSTKLLFTVHTYALQGTEGFSHHEIWEKLPRSYHD